MTRRWRPLVLLSTALAVFACELEEAWTLAVEVRADPRAARSSAAEVLVGFDSRGQGYLVFRVGFACPGAPFSTTATFPVSGPPGETRTVDAWIVPVDGGSPFSCGPLATPQRVPSRGPAGAQASARVQILGGCGSGEVGSAVLVFG